MTDDPIIYHNPRCSKSRATLQLLEENNIAPQIVKYLDTPPDIDTLKSIMQMLGIADPRQIMRTHEAEYKANNLDDDSLSVDDLLRAMVQFPKLIERPIVINHNKAVIGRPPENVLSIL